MKARVIETDEIEELQVNELNDYFTKDGIHYKGLELDFDYEPDYWEKLKHQYAGMAMQSYVNNNVYLSELRKMCMEPREMRDYIADLSIALATALVNRLKEESQCEK